MSHVVLRHHAHENLGLENGVAYVIDFFIMLTENTIEEGRADIFYQ